jgi:hypothetical protein
MHTWFMLLLSMVSALMILSLNIEVAFFFLFFFSIEIEGYFRSRLIWTGVKTFNMDSPS